MEPQVGQAFLPGAPLAECDEGTREVDRVDQPAGSAAGIEHPVAEGRG
ncbi:hypothetical protein [Streptomyces coeruleorubidus]|uniref:Uncharacterized protein n=1 Tax=Streptomyces coeruleorubidus TaxID=116188 RepID=A0ABZ0KMB2_STRC4|nr:MULTISPECIES: hypothetical protein [Streptomyces]WOT39174.1 hypothetical protein R5U08_35750 [Streptomyces coeruleorubidus]